MLDLKKRIISIEEVLILVLSVVIGVGFYGNYIQTHYSVDAYNNAMIKYEDFPNLFFQEGRYTSYLVSKILYMIGGIIPVKDQELVISLCILIFSFTTLLTYIFIKSQIDIKPLIGKVILFLSICSLYFNPFFSDWYQFIDVVICFSTGLFLAIIAGGIVGTKEKLDAKTIGLSIFILTLSLGAYQVLGAYYFIISLILVYINFTKRQDKRLMPYIVKIFIIGSIYGIAAIINVVVTKLISMSSRAEIQINVLKNIKQIIVEQPSIWVTNLGTMPKYVFIFTVMVFIVMLLTIIIKKDIKLLIPTVIIMTIIYVSIFIPHFMLKECWISHRTITALMGLPGIISIFILVTLNPNCDTNKKILVGITALLIGITLIFCIQTQKVSIGLFKTNEIDKTEITFMIREIHTYEEHTGKVVSNISFTSDKYITYGYKGLVTSKDLNIRAMAKSWARASSIKFITGREFNTVKMPDNIYNKYFKDKDWNKFDKDQIVIIEDTAYIAIY